METMKNTEEFQEFWKYLTQKIEDHVENECQNNYPEDREPISRDFLQDLLRDWDGEEYLERKNLCQEVLEFMEKRKGLCLIRDIADELKQPKDKIAQALNDLVRQRKIRTTFEMVNGE